LASTSSSLTIPSFKKSNASCSSSVADDFHLGFGSLVVVPEIGSLGFQFFFFEADDLCIDVKDTPSAPARAPTHF
jgi:hypothetical protein